MGGVRGGFLGLDGYGLCDIHEVDRWFCVPIAIPFPIQIDLPEDMVAVTGIPQVGELRLQGAVRPSGARRDERHSERPERQLRRTIRRDLAISHLRRFGAVPFHI